MNLLHSKRRQTKPVARERRSRRLEKYLRSITATIMLCTGASLAHAKTFTGTFYGQGEECWGRLWIRTKTIQWNAGNYDCFSTYTIVKNDLEARPKNYEYILYKLNHPQKHCWWAYIGVYYYAFSDDDQWSASGFPTEQDYVKFNYKHVITGQASDPNVLNCVLPEYEAHVNP